MSPKNRFFPSVHFLRLAIVAALACVICTAAHASGLAVSSVFSDHMVLQQQMPLPVWGTASPGSEVTVEFGGQTATGQAGTSGQWRVDLQPEAASRNPRTLRIKSGDNILEFKDVLVGEVWFCSGQSNMEWNNYRSLDGDLEKLVKNSGIRLLRARRAQSGEPLADNGAVWSLPTEQAISEFSSVAWHFGRTLEAVLDVPIGLIDSSWGGSPMISWTRPEAIAAHPLLEKQFNDWEEKMAVFPDQLKKWEEDLAAWQKANNIAPETFKHWEHPTAPARPHHDPASSKRPCSLANGMVSPFIPYAMRGVIWYQGESDASWEPERYAERLRVMFADWRKAWSLPDLYIGIVQLANYKDPQTAPSDEPWARLRESQRQFVLDFPKSGMAVVMETGESTDIHPRDKITVGRRLARVALADVYGVDVLRGGPVVESADFRDGSAFITFTQTGTGLISRDRPELGGFTLAGEDGVFHTASAEIVSENQVRVFCPTVPEPVHVRYAWHNNPTEASLFNAERMPAGPFEIRK